jgi:hypothetical protein
VKQVTSHQVNRFADPRQELLRITLQFLANGRVDPLSNVYFLEQSAAVLFLMQAANLEPVAVGMAMKWTGEPAERIRQAIVRYLEHACLSQDKDPYRTLALLPQSSSDAVRQHYRQMMKLFHPDHGLVSDPAKAQGYAALINQAYAALNKKNRPSGETVNHVVSQSVYPPRVASDRLSFTIRKQLFKAIFLLAIFGLIVLYVIINFNSEPVLLSNSPKIAELSSSSAGKKIRAIALIDDNQLTPFAADVQNNIDDLGKDFGTNKIATPSLNQSLPFQDKASKTASAAVSNAAGLRRMDIDSSIVAAQSPPSFTHDRASQEANMQQAEGLTLKAVGKLPRLTKSLTQIQLSRLPIDFLDKYNQGNLDALMSLIDGDVKTGETGRLVKYGLKDAYENLFLDTIKGQMTLENPQWQMQGSRAVGNMAFHADVQHRGSL